MLPPFVDLAQKSSTFPWTLDKLSQQMLERCGLIAKLSFPSLRKPLYKRILAGKIMKISGNRSHLKHGNSQERASDAFFRPSPGLFRVIVHSLLCIAAFVLGFTLSGETRLVVISVKPAYHGSFSNDILHSNRSTSFGLVVDDKKDFTPSVLSESPPSPSLKSSRVHVGRHEILVRSWPHPDPVQTLVAHHLIKRVQQEQQQRYGVQERKLLVVVTPTYVRALQAVYLPCLTNTLRIAPGPLVWIVVEAGGHSNETAELLAMSKLFYYHLAIREPMPTNSKSRKQLMIQMRLEGLRFVRNHRLDGIVIFVDDSSTLTMKLFDTVQKTNWFGTFSVGIQFHSKVSSNSKADILHFENSLIKPRGANSGSGAGSFSAMSVSNLYTKHGNSPPAEKDLPSGFSFLLMGPVCTPEGPGVGWHVHSDDGQDQSIRQSIGYGWAGFVLNTRICWDNVSKPPWIRSWNDLLVENSFLPESPLGFLWNNSYIEPLGDCGQDILMWSVGMKSNARYEFPSRWILRPPLEVVVPSRQTPWATNLWVKSRAFNSSASLPTSPPPPSAGILTNTITQQRNGRIKRAKSRKGKHLSQNPKDVKVNWNAESTLDN